MVGVVALALLGGPAGCGSDAAAICSAAGGTYAGDTCTRWTPYQQAAQNACETHGGVYSLGQNRCEFGEGGP
jgi:hypothetical protein